MARDEFSSSSGTTRKSNDHDGERARRVRGARGPPDAWRFPRVLASRRGGRAAGVGRRAPTAAAGRAVTPREARRFLERAGAASTVPLSRRAMTDNDSSGVSESEARRSDGASTSGEFEDVEDSRAYQVRRRRRTRPVDPRSSPQQPPRVLSRGGENALRPYLARATRRTRRFRRSSLRDIGDKSSTLA